MIPSLRQSFNEAFTEKKYQDFLQDLNALHPGSIEFRIAETPIFIPRDFQEKMNEACESIIDLITGPDFMRLSAPAIPAKDFVAGETGHCHFIAFDFGICENARGEIEPQLIEMQGFPTLFGFQVYYPEVMEKHFDIPVPFTHFLNGYTRDTYLRDFRAIVLGDAQPENVILLEINPHQQKTRIDFYCTQDYLGIQPVHIADLIQEGRSLFYIQDGTGKKCRIERIYNRIIFDDLYAQEKNLGDFVDIRQPLDVTWIPHPNWFYRISKHTLPFIRHPYVPETFFLNEVQQLPADLESYVLKPLFSFAGQGVIIDLTQQDLDNITDPANWILQRKVNYAPIIQTPELPAKAEIRMMYFWKEGDARPKAAINLARLSKGKMIGVRYNKDQDWVGGSVALFPTATDK